VQSLYFYTFVVSFVSGIFLRSFFNVGIPVLLCMLLVAIVVLVLWRKKSRAFFAPYVLCFSMCLFAFTCGALRLEVATWSEGTSKYQSQLDGSVDIVGTIVREPDVRLSTQQLTIRTNDGELLLVTTDRYKEVAYGDSVNVTGKLTKPKSFVTDLGRTFDYEGYLRAKGIEYVISFAHIEVQSHNNGNSIIASLLSIKHAFMSKIEIVISEPYVGLGEGLLLGVKQSLGKDLEDAFRATGVIHIVVLSGYNIMLVVTFVMYLFAFVVPFRSRLLFGTITIILFACLVGLSATVVRASAMAVLVLVAQATGRTYAVLRALMITALCMLLLNPYLLVYDVGFQLSFIATLGLILVSPHIEQYLGFMPTTFKLREFLTATLATQLFVTPFLLYQIGQFSVVAVIVNLLVLPMVPVAMLLTFLTGILGFVNTTLSLPFAYLSYLSLLYIITVVERFANIPFASVTIPPFPFYVVVLAYTLIAFLLWRFIFKAIHPTQGIGLRDLHKWTIVDEEEYATQVRMTQLESRTDVQTPIFFK